MRVVNEEAIPWHGLESSVGVPHTQRPQLGRKKETEKEQEKKRKERKKRYKEQNKTYTTFPQHLVCDGPDFGRTECTPKMIVSFQKGVMLTLLKLKKY